MSPATALKLKTHSPAADGDVSAHGDGTLTAAVAVRNAIAASVQRLLDNEGAALSGSDPEGVHQARVATRRLRSDLRTFRPLLDKRWVKQLRDDLHGLADALGQVRDADVMLGRLVQRVDQLPFDARASAQPLVSVMRRSRGQARGRLVRRMRSQGYAALLDELRSAAREPRTKPKAELDASSVLPQLAVRPWTELRKGVRDLNEPPMDEDLHAIRILAKRARYAAEAVAPVARHSVAELAKAIGALQDVLGEHHDAVVLHAWLLETSSRLKIDPDVAGTLMAAERQAAAGYRQEWPKRWRAAMKARPGSWP